MKIFDICEEIPKKSLLDAIEEDVIRQNRKCMVFTFESCMGQQGCRETIEEIKDYFDIFLILKTTIPSDIKKIEEFFAYGIHGIYFYNETGKYSKEDLDKLITAKEIFPNGLVFAYAGKNKETIDVLLNQKIMPRVEGKDQELIDYILTHEMYKKITSKDLLKFIPIYYNATSFSISDKIKLKMTLEGINLRQKLMVKKVAESFNSSGL
jgi:hypothetical protein